ncbi:MAG: ferrous iron transport protein B [Anaerolineaceae bacterium]
MKFVLIGQPNCGKSTLFNQVCGYKAETGNFTGTTVTYTESKVRVGGEVIQLVDLPGTYTLAGSNPAEQVVFKYLLDNLYDCIINVVDASHLALGLGMTVELLELNKPTILVLNMMDEADRMGIHVDVLLLSQQLGIPVVPMIASKGRGIRDVFITALQTAKVKNSVSRKVYRPDLEDKIRQISTQTSHLDTPLSPEATAIKLVEGDEVITQLIRVARPEILPLIERIHLELKVTNPDESRWVMNIERNAIAATLSAKVIRQGTRKLSLRDKLDDYLLHPFWGYIFLILILYGFFVVVFRIGGLIEAPLLSLVQQLENSLLPILNAGPVLTNIIRGLIQGISGGLTIVLPYLMPFLFGLGFLEDVGYLPRIAFLMDALMHRIGLHGAAVVPFILGFGCNVPSIMSTRTLEDKKERFIAAALATMVPCAARLSIVFGLVANYLGPVVALVIYLFNLLVISITGKILSKIIPEDSPGLILEMPPYRIPGFKTIFQKAWFRIREFIVEAWPILIVGSVVLSLLNFFNLSQYINLILSPFTWILGLPNQVGVPLVFGILRKELSLIMLGQALGSMSFEQILSPVQMITYTVFIIFYVPCLATLVTIRKELGKQAMWTIMGITTMIATLSALVARLVSSIFF